VSEAVDLLLELAAIPSPPGEERGVADVVLRYLRGLGLEPDEDDCGLRIGSTAGNVYVRLEPTAEGTPLFLCAHMDTVPPDGKLEPVVVDGVIRNAGGTILGCDNKAAVTAMLEGVRRVLAGNLPHAGIELVFTPMEEVGLITTGCRRRRVTSTTRRAHSAKSFSARRGRARSRCGSTAVRPTRA